MSKRLSVDREEAADIAGSSKMSKSQNRYLEWEEDYFMATAILSSKRSKDPETQVGACIVDKHNRVVGIGYNGFPRNCSDDEFPWQKSKHNLFESKHTYVVHAEANAILNSNSTNLDDTRLYTTLFPCNECTKLIIQTGIKEIYYISDKYTLKYQAAKRMLNAVGIVYKQHVPKQNIVINIYNSK